MGNTYQHLYPFIHVFVVELNVYCTWNISHPIKLICITHRILSRMICLLKISQWQKTSSIICIDREKHSALTGKSFNWDW